VRIDQRVWAGSSWRPLEGRPETNALADADLVLAFGDRRLLESTSALAELARAYPRALLAGCSTAGEICGDTVVEAGLVGTAIRFEGTEVDGSLVEMGDGPEASREAGEALGRALARPGLVHVLVFAEGLRVNGSALVRGLASTLPTGVTVSGGLSADGERFGATRLVWGAGTQPDAVLGIGLSGSRLRLGIGSLGGWDPFGPERLVTRAKENELFELDGRSALELYRRYLGDHADGLPAAGLLFPLAVRSGHEETPVVRTILGVDEDRQSLIFAGEIPEGALARLMKANFDRLIDGATDAAIGCRRALAGGEAELALLISCVGRKMVLRQRVEEEVESVREVLGPRPAFAGFYSYGEISPAVPGGACALHNQTMTITTLLEA